MNTNKSEAAFKTFQLALSIKAIIGISNLLNQAPPWPVGWGYWAAFIDTIDPSLADRTNVLTNV